MNTDLGIAVEAFKQGFQLPAETSAARLVTAVREAFKGKRYVATAHK
jgi:hypothetical protein